MSTACRCFLALWGDSPVAFCATVSLIGRKNRWRISRIVTLPDYQGIGIGMAVAEAVAELHLARGAPPERDGQPPGPAGPLPPLAALAGGASPQDGRRQDGEVH